MRLDPAAGRGDFCLEVGCPTSAASTALVRAHAEHARALRTLLDRLAQTSAPKTIVYISEGLVARARVGRCRMARPGGGARPGHDSGPAARRRRRPTHRWRGEPATPGRDRALGRDGLELVAERRRAAGSSRSHRQRRQRVRPPGARAVRLLPPQLRARGRAIATASRTRSRSRSRADRRRDPLAQRVRGRYRRAQDRRGDAGRHASGAAAGDRHRPEGRRLHAAAIGETDKLRILMVAEIDRAAQSRRQAGARATP